MGVEKVIPVLESRLASTLPCNCGKSLDAVETDSVAQRIVEGITQIAETRPGNIILCIATLLDDMPKPATLLSSDRPPFDVLQSQLLLLRILVACMAHSWSSLRNMGTADARGLPQLLPRLNWRTNCNETNELPPEANEPKALYCSSGVASCWPKSSRRTIGDCSILAPDLLILQDPPPLEESTARFVASILLRFTDFQCSDTLDAPAIAEPAPSLVSAASAGNLFPAKCQNPAVQEICQEITTAAARAFFYVSGANWSFVFGRLKAKIAALATSEENADLAEVKSLEWCNLNKSRLSAVTQVLSGTFLSLKKPAQYTLSSALRKCIWNWIDIYPLEFNDVWMGASKVEGCDELFDQVHSLADNTKKKSIFWPLQTMLLVISPNSVRCALISEHASQRKFAFVEELRKSLKGSRLNNVGISSSVDICKILTYIKDSELSMIRQLIPEIELELKEHVFDTLQPIMTGDGSVDQRLITECFTTLYRLSPKATMRSLVNVCFHEAAPASYSIAIAKACLTLASEGVRLPWRPGLAPIYHGVGNRLKKLLHAQNTSEKTKVEKKPRRSERQEYLSTILQLYQVAPGLALFSPNSEAQAEENRLLLFEITGCLSYPSSAIRTKAAQTLMILHHPNIIEQWGPPETLMRTFWTISCQVLLSVARQILDFTDREEGSRYVLELLLQLLSSRNEFIKSRKEGATVGIESSDRVPAGVAVEIALLVFLCSPETDICSIAAACFARLCQEASYTDEVEDQQHLQLTIMDNIACYRELSKPEIIITGRVAQQRRIRKILRGMEKQTPGNVGAWKEVYNRWKSLGQAILRSGESTLSEDKVEWQNYCGFLCSLGGCCLGSGPRLIRLPEDVTQMVSRFMEEMTDILVSDVVMVRESVKEIIGADLSPRLYGMLYEQLERNLARFNDVGGDPSINEKYRLFVEQAISVMKATLERIERRSEYMTDIDLGGLILSFGAYLNRFGTGNVALRMKIKLCQLIEVLMQKRECIHLRQDIKRRNNLLETVLEFFSDFASKPGIEYQAMHDESYKADKLQRDLDSACMKAVVSLVHQLPLQPAAYEPNISHAKSQLYLKYHGFFIRLLNRCRVAEHAVPSVFAARLTADIPLALPSKEIVRDHGTLKDLTILALTNLLSANIESGLRYSLFMGYHEDSKIRTAFLRVLTNMLQQGTEFEMLGENVLSDRYSKLIDLLVEGDSSIAMAVCDVCGQEVEEVASLLLYIFESRNETMRLLRSAITREIANTETPNTLFRRNSTATRLLTVYARQQGSEYLRATLQPLIDDLIKSEGQLSCEVDPSKLQPGEDLSENVRALSSVCQKFLHAIVNTASAIPRPFREICNYISMMVIDRFPEARQTAVGGFIFLRFFCPAIVAPEAHEIVSQPPAKDVRRTLLLVAKVVQNLANNVLFGAKESFMSVLTDFLTSNMPVVNKYLQDISAPISLSIENNPVNVPVSDEQMRLLHRLLFDHLEYIGRDVNTHDPTKYRLPSVNAQEKDAGDARKQYDKLSTLLAHLGPPPESPASELSGVTAKMTIASNQLFSDFMQRHANRNVDGFRQQNLFFEGGTSRDRRPVLFFIARRLKVETADMELLIFFLTKTLERFIRKPYEVLLDLSFFDQANEIPSEWVNLFLRILPNEAANNLAALYLYNINTQARKYATRMFQSSLAKLRKRIHFFITLSDLVECVPSAGEKLPKSTVALEIQGQTFTQVTRVSHQTRTPVELRVSNEYVQIITAKKQETVTLATQTRDVIAISSTDDVTVISQRKETDLFVIKYGESKSSPILSSPKRDQIIRAILSCKARFQVNDRPEGAERMIRPNDIQPTLLNMAFLNIGSDDPQLRSAAYDLLTVLNLSFQFDVGNQLLSAKDICIPANSTNFVVLTSTTLAQTQKSMTLDFLREFLNGFGKSSSAQKHLGLAYCVPWLPNLAQFCGEGDVQKTQEITRMFVDLTVKEQEMYPSFQAQIWGTLGKVDNLLPLVIETFVQYAVDYGVSTAPAELAANTAVALESVRVPGKLISRLRKALTKTCLKPTARLAQHPIWGEIVVLLRFLLILSFNNRLHVQNFLPELCHIVTLVVATGSPLTRDSVHGVAINIVHSLCTSLPIPAPNLKRLSNLLGELAKPKSRLLFGLRRSGTNIFAVGQDSVETEEALSLNSLETIVQMFKDIVSAGAPTVALANRWRARWMSLVCSTAFQFNPAIQPRAFVAMGCLAKEEVDDDLVYQILVGLRGSLKLLDENDSDLVVSIVVCLMHIVENLPAGSRYLEHMFWLAVALIQIGHPALFPSCVQLIHVTVRTLSANGSFNVESPRAFFMATRQLELNILTQIDMLVGIHFHADFAFALGATLLKGLKYPPTRASTMAVLTFFLELAWNRQTYAGKIPADLLGFLAPLLPAMASEGNAEKKSILWRMGIPDLGMRRSRTAQFAELFDMLIIPDRTTALLLLSMTVTMLNIADNEEETYFLFNFLAEAARMMPDLMPLISDIMVPKINHVLANSQTPEVIQAAEIFLFRSLSDTGSNNQGRTPRSDHAYLAELGFAGLAKAGSLQPPPKAEILRRGQLAGMLVEKIIS